MTVQGPSNISSPSDHPRVKTQQAKTGVMSGGRIVTRSETPKIARGWKAILNFIQNIFRSIGRFISSYNSPDPKKLNKSFNARKKPSVLSDSAKRIGQKVISKKRAALKDGAVKGKANEQSPARVEQAPSPKTISPSTTISSAERPRSADRPRIDTSPPCSPKTPNLTIDTASSPQAIGGSSPKPPTPPAVSPLFLVNYRYSRCYIDSTLEVMLSQDNIRQKIDEVLHTTVDQLTRIAERLENEELEPEQTEELENRADELLRQGRVLESLLDLVIAVDNTQDLDLDTKKELFEGPDSPGERVREAIFDSHLNLDLADQEDLYTQQDAAAVVLLLNDLLGNTIQTSIIDRAENDPHLTVERPSRGEGKLQLNFDRKKVQDYQTDRRNRALALQKQRADQNKLRADQANQRKRGVVIGPKKRVDPKVVKVTDKVDVEHPSAEISTLDDLIRSFFAPERIERRFGKKDSQGKYIDEPAISQAKIKTFPDSLALHVNRTAYDSGVASKLEIPVSLPRDGIVDLTPHRMEDKPGESCRYEITGYIIHEGNDLKRGHYISCVKIGDKFYKCNDLSPNLNVEITADQFYNNRNAYMVMLKKIPAEAPATPERISPAAASDRAA